MSCQCDDVLLRPHIPYTSCCVSTGGDEYVEGGVNAVALVVIISTVGKYREYQWVCCSVSGRIEFEVRIALNSLKRIYSRKMTVVMPDHSVCLQVPAFDHLKVSR